MSMDELLKANFGELDETLTVSFKKTMMTAPYEPEAVQADAQVEFKGSMSAIERETITNILMNTTEYTVICHLFKKNMITSNDFKYKKDLLEASSEAMLKKYEKLTGNDRSVILNRVGEADKEMKVSDAPVNGAANS